MRILHQLVRSVTESLMQLLDSVELKHGVELSVHAVAADSLCTLHSLLGNIDGECLAHVARR